MGNQHMTKIESPFKHGADFEHLRRVIMRETTDGPVPIIELAADAEIMSAVTGIDFAPSDYSKLRAMNQDGSLADMDQETLEIGIRFMNLNVSFSKMVGYDYVTATPIVPVRRTRSSLKNDPNDSETVRVWQEEHQGLVMSREDYDAYTWPAASSINLGALDFLASMMGPEMKAMCFVMGIFEDLRAIMGFEQMAYQSLDDPELLGDILENLTVLCEATVDRAAAHPACGAVFYADDLGHSNSTILSPDFMRKWLFPRHKRIADACHRQGKPFLFHSCGQVDAIMEDLIETVGIDSLHSFEDKIEPVEEVYRKYGDRISILGGVDVDLLSRGAPEQVRTRTREILEICAPGGGFCMGSGNSLPSFVKVENYYAMLDETARWNETH
jgi:uroporphyrinogen decarboxylase